MSLSLYGLISDSESTFIIDGVNNDCRSDGRTCNDFRFFKSSPVVAETFFRKVEIEHDVIQTTNGSARVRIGATEILVGVKERRYFTIVKLYALNFKEQKRIAPE